MDVRCREGHVDGTRQPTIVRHVVDVIIIGDAVHRTVVARRGTTVVGQPSVQLGKVACSVTLNRQIGSRRDDGILVIRHRHVEAGSIDIAMDISSRIGHGRRSYGEHIAGAVRGGVGVYCTVVGGRRLCPGHCSRADSSIVGLRDVGRRSCDCRCLIVGHRHVEGRRGGIAGGVDSRVGHGRRAHGERVARAVCGGEAGHSAVVAGGQLRPRHRSAAVACIVGLRDVGRSATDGRGLIVGHRDVEGRRAHIAVDVRGRVRDRRRSYSEGIARAVR